MEKVPVFTEYFITKLGKIKVKRGAGRGLRTRVKYFGCESNKVLRWLEKFETEILNRSSVTILSFLEQKCKPISKSLLIVLFFYFHPHSLWYEKKPKRNRAPNLIALLEVKDFPIQLRHINSSAIQSCPLIEVHFLLLFQIKVS